ncbi:MAG TPA: ABC transporter ATP-binding protein, partial [Acidimicrobiaceae bacterium]|nr:ABC transporter ATP-binding protein [Acidimicrobiaceae bacterium]
MAPLLEVADLHVAVDGAEILRGIDLAVPEGELHALMGPNGSGKSTLANAVLGNPAYGVTEGTIRLRGEDVTSWAPDVRAKAGMFLAFQYPEEISGVSVTQFLRQAVSARAGEERSALEVRMAMGEWMERLGMDPAFAERYLNEGFSGGEKK